MVPPAASTRCGRPGPSSAFTAGDTRQAKGPWCPCSIVQVSVTEPFLLSTYSKLRWLLLWAVTRPYPAEQGPLLPTPCWLRLFKPVHWPGVSAPNCALVHGPQLCHQSSCNGRVSISQSGRSTAAGRERQGGGGKEEEGAHIAKMVRSPSATLANNNVDWCLRVAQILANVAIR